MRAGLRRRVCPGWINPARTAALQTDRATGRPQQSSPAETAGHFMGIGKLARKCRTGPIRRILAQCSKAGRLVHGPPAWMLYVPTPHGVPAMNQHAKIDTAAAAKMSP